MAAVEFSRPAAAVRELGDAARDDGNFIDKRVLLTGAASILASPNGLWMSEDCLRLMVRTWREVTVYVPPDAVTAIAALKRVAHEVCFATAVRFMEEVPRYADFDGILSVGGNVETALPWTTINSNGWLAHVSSTDKRVFADIGAPNPIGAMAAASLGVAEVFKRTALKPSHFDLFDGLTFSTFDCTVGAEDPGPPLPDAISMPPALFLGQGAIGNANVLLAGQLPLIGRALLVDKDEYGQENLGTCVLIGRSAANARAPKAHWNCDYLRGVGSKLEVEPLKGDIEQNLPKVKRYLELVINGLDRVEPRHAIQDAWPDAIVDGALHGFKCQMIAYDHGAGYGCLRCLFDKPAARDPHAVQAQMLGVAVEVVASDMEITAEHVAAAPEDRRAFLETKVGERAHAVACARAIDMKGLFADTADSDFAPSVPFVATMTAVLCIGEVVRRLIGFPCRTRRVQFDVLVGPTRAHKINETAKIRCRCRRRVGSIEKLRNDRVEGLR